MTAKVHPSLKTTNTYIVVSGSDATAGVLLGKVSELGVQDVFVIEESDAHVESTEHTHGVGTELSSVDVVSAHTGEHVTGSRSETEDPVTTEERIEWPSHQD